MNDSLTSSKNSAPLTASTRRKAVLGALGALLLAAASAGCSAATTPEEAAKPVATEQAQAVEKGERGEHEGIAGAVLEAASKLDLSPQQKQAVDAIRTDLRAKAAPIKEARAQYVAALADGVSKGAIDPQALAAPKANLARAAEAYRPVLQDALNRLHATLNADQRAKLVDAVHARHEGAKEWKHEEGGGMHAHMKKMAAELELTPDQMQSIKTNLRAAHKEHEGEKMDRAAMEAKREEMRAHMQKMGDAFKSETFDARALDIGKEMSAMAGHHAEKAEKFLSIVTPILTAPQRAKLGAMIQKHGAMMGNSAPADEDE